MKEKPVCETVLLDCAEDQGTELLGTIGLEMIQDIVYMQDTTEISVTVQPRTLHHAAKSVRKLSG